MEQKPNGLSYEEAVKIATARGETVTATYCPMCGPSTNCAVYAFCKDGKLLRIAGRREGSKNRGVLCAKGLAAAEWNNSPDRIRQPLLRTGEKGEGKFREISWDEALDIIAGKLKEQKEKYGPESLAILSPAARQYKEISLRFLAVHGSPNHAHSGICAMQNSFSCCYTVGGNTTADFANAELVIYWGRGPASSGPATDRTRNLMTAKKNNARIYNVKPSIEPDVALSTKWVPVRPGTDAALALGLLHVVMRDDLVDHEFVDKWCYGFEELKEHVKQYSPEWAEKVSGVPAQLIESMAKDYATTKKACIEIGNGLEHSPSASCCVRAICSLMAITGHLDREGGNLLGPPGGPGPKPKSVMRFDLYTQEMIDKLVSYEMPKEFQPFKEGTEAAYFGAIESVLTGKPYKIRTLIAPGTQPLVSTRGTKVVLEALKQVDFFVTIDVMKMAEYNYADLILPVATHFEAEHPFAFDGGKLLPRPACVEPLGDYKTMFHFFIELAERLGYGEDFWHGSYDEFENERLSPFGITIDELRKHPEGIAVPRGEKKPRKYENYEKHFAAKSQRIGNPPFLPQGKVALYNTSFEAAGYDALPTYREPPESLTGTPELAEKYPLILGDYHSSKAFSQSWLRNVPSLRRITPEAVVEMHPLAASARGIKDGDRVKVESPHGTMVLKAEVTERIRPDTVMVLHGWWQGCSELGISDTTVLDGGANVNNMYDVSGKAYDPLVTAMSAQTLVEVTKLD